MQLKGTVAIVTGGNGGLGQRICHALARAGSDVAVVYAQSQDAAKSVAAELRKAGVRAEAMGCDVTNPSQVQRMVARVVDTFGKVDLLVNDAAYNKWIPFNDLDAMTYEEWQKILAVNLTGPMLCSKAVAPAMQKAGGGRIVNIASVAGKTGRAGMVAYCATKAAVISMTQGMAEELGPMNITVNAICPGFINTAMFTEVISPMLGALWNTTPDDAFDRFIRQSTYLRRDQRPEDIAEAAVYLCRADNVTGITLTVAGGAEVH